MEISVEKFKEIQNSAEYIILDVRTPSEFAACHVKGAINLPLNEISESSVDSLNINNKKILTICHSGVRSLDACKKISGYGYTATSVKGGTVACVELGLEINSNAA